MNSKTWIITGYIAIIGAKILPVVLAFQTMDNMISDPSVSRMRSMNSLAILNAIGEILFWGGIILVVFGFIKYYKEEK